MCGIAGWFSQTPTHQSQSPQLESMISRLVHRGPDGTQCEMLQHAALGHTRLSIIDLQSGTQPMYSIDKKVCITFNGEIYNYQEIRLQLISEGYQFQTESDTEVIIALYQIYGTHKFNRLRGMYAFALWDQENAIGILCRDPLGIKPLFIKTDHKQSKLLFASEAKAILAHEQSAPTLDLKQLHLLMNFRYIPNDGSLFSGITQIKPGEILIWNTDRSLETQRIKMELQVQYADTLAAFEDSVVAHFTSDVEVGCYLSGGIDSALIASYGKNISDYPLQTFTLDVGDSPMEAKYAKQTAKTLGIINHCESVSDNINHDIHHLIWHLETPKINSLQVGLLAQLASRHVKVSLSGVGGDELFYGYNIHRILQWTLRCKKSLPTFAHRYAGHLLNKLAEKTSDLPFSEPKRQFQMLEHLGEWGKVYGLLRNVWDCPALRNTLYGPRLLDEELPDCFEYLEGQWPAGEDPVTSAAEFEFRHKLVNDLLWQEDRMSMAHGLEVRVPFVDTWLAHYTQKIPRRLLMPGTKLKYHMRQQFQIALDYEVARRPKSGFQVSAPYFFHKHLIPLADYYLDKNRVKNYGLFNYTFIEKILKLAPRKKLRWHYFMLYLMILTHIWIEIFENQKDYNTCFE